VAEKPWGEPAYVLVGALSHSGRVRVVFSERWAQIALAALSEPPQPERRG
jgi:hypothetical protein